MVGSSLRATSLRSQPSQFDKRMLNTLPRVWGKASVVGLRGADSIRTWRRHLDRGDSLTLPLSEEGNDAPDDRAASNQHAGPSRVMGDRITGEAECAQGVEARQSLPNVHSSNA